MNRRSFIQRTLVTIAVMLGWKPVEIEEAQKARWLAVCAKPIGIGLFEPIEILYELTTPGGLVLNGYWGAI